MSKILLLKAEIDETTNEISIASEANTEERAEFLEGALIKFFTMYPHLLASVTAKLGASTKELSNE